MLSSVAEHQSVVELFTPPPPPPPLTPLPSRFLANIKVVSINFARTKKQKTRKRLDKKTGKVTPCAVCNVHEERKKSIKKVCKIGA